VSDPGAMTTAAPDEARGGRHAAAVDPVQEEDLRLWAAVARVARGLLASIAEGDLLTRLAAHVAGEMSCDASHVFLWEEQRQGFSAVAQSGENEEIWVLARLLEIPPVALGGLLERLRRDRAVPVSFAATPAPPSGVAELSAEQLELSLRVVSLARRGGWQRILFIALTQGDRVVGFQTACKREDAGFGARQVTLARRLSYVASFAAACASLGRALAQASRLQSQFVANMSHELRTPLNVIMGYNALLLEGEYGPVDEFQRDILGRVAVRSRELLDLITSTLDVGRLESGRMPFDWRMVDVPRLMAEVESETRHLQTRSVVRFFWHCEEPLPALYTDPSKLRVVLANLIANAAKFTEKGEVDVVARATREAFQFVVSDTGIGIAPEMLPVIFEPFRKAGRDGDERPGGVGLGLYIVRSLVERLRGRVFVESRPGQGSRFVVQLPMRRGEEE
jgi:signal transduction histidine kinase